MAGPDRGYSWVIVFACGLIHFAFFGLFRASGVMYVALLQNYDVTREEASWPFALCSAVFQLVGPVAGILTHYMSQRKACLLGSTIATVGIAACYFAESVMWINVFFGFVHGVGFGLVTTFVPVTLNQYFLKYKSTAMGIAFSGGTLSSLIFPIAMEWLLENYTLQDSFLLLSGVTMNTLIASALLSSPSWLKKNKMSKDADDSGVSVDLEKQNGYDGIPTIKEESPMLSSTSWLKKNKMAKDADGSVDVKKQNGYDGIRAIESSIVCSSRTDSNRTMYQTDEQNPEQTDTIGSNNDSVLFEGEKHTEFPNAETELEVKHESEMTEPFMIGLQRAYIFPKTDTESEKYPKHRIYRSESQLDMKPEVAELIMSGVHQVHSIPKTDTRTEKFPKHRTYSGQTQLDMNDCKPEVTEPLVTGVPQVHIVSKTVTRSEYPKPRAYHSIRDILLDPMFHLISMSMCVYFLGLHSFFVVILDFALDKGIDESRSIYILCAFSVTDLIGRAGLGWITDKHYISRKNMLALNFAILGALFQSYAVSSNLLEMMLIAAACGLSVGSSITIFFILQAECIKVKNLTLVVGLCSFVNGISSFVRPFVIGLFRDTIGSYNLMFHFLGFNYFLFSIIWMVESWRSRKTHYHLPANQA